MLHFFTNLRKVTESFSGPPKIHSVTASAGHDSGEKPWALCCYGRLGSGDPCLPWINASITVTRTLKTILIRSDGCGVGKTAGKSDPALRRGTPRLFDILMTRAARMRWVALALTHPTLASHTP